MKRNWSGFDPKVIILFSEKKGGSNMGRPCCGGSCIGGNCKAIPKITSGLK